MRDRDLIEIAVKYAKNAWAPYSRHYVGAALECADGKVYTGSSVETAALGGTICAERAAVCTAVTQGERKFVRLAIYAEGENYCVPCGACRQFLMEFAPDMDVLCVRGDGHYESYRLRELLPHSPVGGED